VWRRGASRGGGCEEDRRGFEPRPDERGRERGGFRCARAAGHRVCAGHADGERGCAPCMAVSWQFAYPDALKDAGRSGSEAGSEAATPLQVCRRPCASRGRGSCCRAGCVRTVAEVAMRVVATWTPTTARARAQRPPRGRPRRRPLGALARAARGARPRQLARTGAERGAAAHRAAAAHQAAGRGAGCACADCQEGGA